MMDKEINLGKISIKKIGDRFTYRQLMEEIMPKYKREGWKIPDKRIFFYIQNLKTLEIGDFPEWIYFSSDDSGFNFYFSTFTIYDMEDSDEYMHVGTGFKGAGEFVNKKYACVLYKEN
jgi:hypothetical protein